MNKLLRYYKQSGSIYYTLKCLWDWDIKTLFTGELYIPLGKKVGLKRITSRKYYWKRLFNIQ